MDILFIGQCYVMVVIKSQKSPRNSVVMRNIYYLTAASGIFKIIFCVWLRLFYETPLLKFL